jgi:mevalonate kinase
VSAPAGAVAQASATAPAKVILLGEHAVNRGGRALATAVGMRVRCTVRRRTDGNFALRSGAQRAWIPHDELAAFAAAVEHARSRNDPAAVARLAEDDFFAPARAALGQLTTRLELNGLDIEWSGGPPVGCGLGSGAAANCALAVAAAHVAGRVLTAAEIAEVAWHGDVLAHGGIASALDSSACAHGGVIEYSVAAGARPIACPVELPLVIGDTGVSAFTGAVNAGVARRLAERPELWRVFEELAELVDAARDALAAGELPALGELLRRNQLLLEALGVSNEPIQRLVEASLQAGALGAKLSGSGGGGIVIALAPPGASARVAAAIEAVGGRAWSLPAATAGAHPEPERTHTP